MFRVSRGHLSLGSLRSQARQLEGLCGREVSPQENEWVGGGEKSGRRWREGRGGEREWEEVEEVRRGRMY